MHKTIPFLPCRWLLAVLLCDGEVRTLPSGAEGQGRAPSWGPHMAGRASCGWTNGVQRPEGWSGRTTRTPIGDVETGPRVGRWTREEGQRGTGQAGSEEDPMHTQSNTHTWEHSTKGHMFTSVQLFSVAQSCLILCDPMDTSLLRPWDFLGKSTGVGCLFLLQGTSRPRYRTQVSRIVDRHFTI